MTTTNSWKVLCESQAGEPLDQISEQIDIAQWITFLMREGKVTICPRCCESLISNGMRSYLGENKVEQGRALEILRELESNNVGARFHVGSGREDGDFICQGCISEYDNRKETYKDWPIGEGE